MNKIFEKVPVQIQNKSGFDCSHENCFTANVGTLTPCFTKFMIPGDSLDVSLGAQIQLPPVATDFYGRVKAHFEAFFVPLRILYGGWKQLVESAVDSSGNSSTSSVGINLNKYIPSISDAYTKSQMDYASYDYGPGTLADYLGFKVDPFIDGDHIYINIPNMFPFLAYHRIWNDWYRDSRIQASIFEPDASASLSRMPWLTLSYNNGSSINWSGSTLFQDASRLYRLRQRNWPKDYFTSATSSPQFGDMMSVVPSEADGFTIAQLRSAYSLQQFMERYNLAGHRYNDVIKATFGVYPADAITDRAIYLGRQVFDVYTKSVFQQSLSDEQLSRNPFYSVGSKYGNSQAVGSGHICNFDATEHGILMILFSLVPEPTYGTGVSRSLYYSRFTDFPNPMLQSVGDQPIYCSEIVNNGYGHADIFGYTQRFAEHKFMLNEVHGLLRDGCSLEAFANKRSYNLEDNSSLVISSDFLEIPTTALDDVSATSSGISEYGCWVDVGFNVKLVSPLAAYSIPTLDYHFDTHTEVIDNGGKRL